MESDAVSAQHQLDELEKHRGEVAERLVMPAWHRALWAVTWAGTFTAVVTTDNADLLLLVFAAFYAIWGFLTWWERRRTGVKVSLMSERMSRTDGLIALGGVVLVAPAAYLLIRYDIAWPMVITYVGIGIAMFISARRRDRRRADEVRRT